MEEQQRRDPDTKDARLRKALSNRIAYYHRAVARSRVAAKGYRLALIFLAAATTIVVGLQIDGWETSAKNIALVLSAVATAVASIEAFTDHRGKWVESQEVFLGLLNLRARYNFLTTGATPEDEESIAESHWEEMQEILRGAHKDRVESLAEATKGDA